MENSRDEQFFAHFTFTFAGDVSRGYGCWNMETNSFLLILQLRDIFHNYLDFAARLEISNASLNFNINSNSSKE